MSEILDIHQASMFGIWIDLDDDGSGYWKATVRVPEFKDSYFEITVVGPSQTVVSELSMKILRSKIGKNPLI